MAAIKNCFTHCLKQTGNDKAEEQMERTNLEGTEKDTCKHGVLFSRVGSQNGLNSANENDEVEHSTLQELGREVVCCPDISDDESVDVDQFKVVAEEVYSRE